MHNCPKLRLTCEGCVVSASPVPWVVEWVNQFVSNEATSERVDWWVDRTVRGIQEEVPEVALRPGLAQQLDEAVRENWLSFLRQLPRSRMEFVFVPGAERIARESAQTALPLEALNRIYRIAQQSTWSYVTDLVGSVDDSRAERADLLIFLWERASAWIDRAINETSRVYHESRRRIDISRNALWLEAVTRILAGEALDSRWISSELGGYSLSGHHTAFVLATDDQEADTESLEESYRHLAGELRLSQPLVVRPGGRRLWMWAATTRPLSVDAHDVSMDGPMRSIRVAVGPSRPGRSGFVSSHNQSLRMLNVLHPDKRGLFLYSRYELLALLGCDEEVDGFVRRTLGDLLNPEEHEARLRQTVATYLALDGSADRTAAALSVHRNTVRYRLQQAGALLGDRLSVTSSDVALALMHLDLCHAGRLAERTGA